MTAGMLAFDKLSIRARFLIAPFIAVFFALIIFFNANQVINSNILIFQKINKVHLSHIGEINELILLIFSVNDELFSLLNSDIESRSEEKIYISGKKQINKLHILEQRLNALVTEHLGPTIEERDNYQDLQRLLTDYRHQVSDVIELVTVDSAMAAQHFSLAHEKIIPLNRLFLALYDYHKKEVSAQSALIKSTLNTENYITELSIVLILLMLLSAFYFAEKTTASLNKVRAEQEKERKEATAQIIQASKLATLGEMSTSISHELNQPLNVISMAAGNSRRKISKGTANTEYLNNKLERIEEQTARAAAIIDHMRMFGREAREEAEPIDPRNVVTSTLNLIGAQLRLAEIEIVTELAEDCPLILGHAIQLEQVLLNLLTNARDAIAESDRDGKITLRVFSDDEGVQISVGDTGGGIPDDALPRIFEPFYTTKEVGKGTGLGLSVGYGIIRDMNGTIVAENIDDGAQFTITMPSAS